MTDFNELADRLAHEAKDCGSEAFWGVPELGLLLDEAAAALRLASRTPPEGHGAREALAWQPATMLPEGKLIEYPSFYTEGPHICVVYDCDNGPAIGLVQARLDVEEMHWHNERWLPLLAALPGDRHWPVLTPSGIS